MNGKVNKLTDRSFVEPSVYEFGEKWAKSLGPAIKATDDFIKIIQKVDGNFKAIKSNAIEFEKLEKAYKKVGNRKEFLATRQREKDLTEQNSIAYKEQIKVEKQLITIKDKQKLAIESTNKALIREKLELNRVNK